MHYESPLFDKYDLYKKSVQEPEADIDFLTQVYQELYAGELPRTLKEDFCGTFTLCCEWVKAHPNNKAIGIDNDISPISYGKQKYHSLLTDEQKKRILICQDDVRNIIEEKSNITCALNFSYFIFKSREDLKNYFKSAYHGIHSTGILALDIFGGSQCYEANEEETEYTDSKFSYFWDQTEFDPITNNAQFHIHFKLKNQKKIENVFTYNWRMWSIPELKDILEEVGFKHVHIYWEGTDEEGEGNGKFVKSNKGEDCESWIAYIIAQK